jgi:hypothetical protein
MVLVTRRADRRTEMQGHEALCLGASRVSQGIDQCPRANTYPQGSLKPSFPW